MPLSWLDRERGPIWLANALAKRASLLQQIGNTPPPSTIAELADLLDLISRYGNSLPGNSCPTSEAQHLRLVAVVNFYNRFSDTAVTVEEILTAANAETEEIEEIEEKQSAANALLDY